jgi:hypothetical protein
MLQQPYSNPQVIYEADQVHVETVKTLREKLHGVCKTKLMNKYVKVQTLDGHEFEGIIVFIDGSQIYLSLAEDDDRSYRIPYPGYPYPGYPQPYPPFNPGSAILPLVLYDLLAITLLYP